MDHMKILKRAWHILWSYKALWVFGIILAITTASFQSSSSGGSSGRSSSGSGNNTSFYSELPDGIAEGLQDLESTINSIDFESTGFWVPVVIGAICLALVFFVIGNVLRYVSETAMIRMVNEYEEDQRKYTVGKGFRLGWSRKAFHLFLIDLVLGVPMAVISIIAIMLSLSPLLLLITEKTFASILGVIMAIGLFFITLILVIVFSAAVKFVIDFAKRACILESQSVFDSIRRGFDVIWQNLKDSGLMWLIMIGIKFAYNIVLLPVSFLLFFAALLISGVIVLAVGGVLSLILSVATPLLFSLFLAIPVFMLVLGGPSAFLNGLKEVFISSTWTLTYRELLALEKLEQEPDAGDLVELEA